MRLSCMFYIDYQSLSNHFKSPWPEQVCGCEGKLLHVCCKSGVDMAFITCRAKMDVQNDFPTDFCWIHYMNDAQDEGNQNYKSSACKFWRFMILFEIFGHLMMLERLVAFSSTDQLTIQAFSLSNWKWESLEGWLEASKLKQESRLRDCRVYTMIYPPHCQLIWPTSHFPRFGWFLSSHNCQAVKALREQSFHSQ